MIKFLYRNKYIVHFTKMNVPCNKLFFDVYKTNSRILSICKSDNYIRMGCFIVLEKLKKFLNAMVFRFKLKSHVVISYIIVSMVEKILDDYETEAIHKKIEQYEKNGYIGKGDRMTIEFFMMEMLNYTPLTLQEIERCILS